ncbi:MAG: glutaredoxin family protein [Candidatus Nanoarchaeia archaeon]
MVKIRILSTPGCPACAKVKGMLDDMGTKYEVVDLSKHPEMAAKYQIMSAPGIVINGKLKFTGAPSKAELEKAIKEAK